MKELLGVRFFCKCERGYFWHERAVSRWLQRRGFRYEDDSLRFSCERVWNGGLNMTATWVPVTRGQAQFPIIPDRRRDSTVAPHPMKVPWSIAELAYSVYVRHGGGDQSLERLAERGGFGAAEMDMFLPDWRERVAAL